MCAFLLVNKAVTWYISIISKCYTANSQFLFQLTVLHTINIKRSWCKDLIKIWFWGKQNSSWGNLDNAKLFIKLFILLYVKSESTLKEKKSLGGKCYGTCYDRNFAVLQLFFLQQFVFWPIVTCNFCHFLVFEKKKSFFSNSFLKDKNVCIESMITILFCTFNLTLSLHLGIFWICGSKLQDLISIKISKRLQLNTY